MTNFQMKINRLIVDRYNQNTLFFLHVIKFSLKRIYKNIKDLIDLDLEYKYSIIDYDSYKNQTSLYITDIEKEFPIIDQWVERYRDYIDFNKYHMVKTQLRVNCFEHNIFPPSIFQISDPQQINQHLNELDEVIETLLEFQEIILNDERVITELEYEAESILK